MNLKLDLTTLQQLISNFIERNAIALQSLWLIASHPNLNTEEALIPDGDA
jgi:hypothetical protein